ncbi:PD40 domain-containing protein [Psittacicella gerlachiana]|uniref:TolB N-terminal domain-containing protein n=1 Tax=Psittacicella gerlachiana TaxID=2028574 RepID=A0A3A1Y829_9GAMM|nr:PD40 domain-containing protein [Psittacicella gerlachiana]RIY33691.1 hypothetical protein CKF59_06250 [Psittacicella gerlachiana]
MLQLQNFSRQISLLSLTLIGLSSSVFAQTEIATNNDFSGTNVITIDQGRTQAAKIAIGNFNYGPGVQLPQKLETIIGNDLKNSGIFAPIYANQFPQSLSSQLNPEVWFKAGVFYLVTGQVSALNANQLRLDYNLYDMSGAICPVGQACISRTVTLNTSENRDLAHTAANDVYQAILKQPGDFLTKIAFVQQPIAGVNKYNLYIADYDGANPRQIYTSDRPILSPNWSGDNQRIAFVSYSLFNSRIMQYDLNSRAVSILVNKEGNSTAPAYSSDGQYLVYASGVNGSSDLYLRNLSNGTERNLTNGRGRNTEPSWYGNSVIFTSDRSGTAAIYQMDLSTGNANRISRTSGQTTDAQISYPVQTMVMINRDRLTTQNLNSNKISQITNTFLDESLSISPSGRMVIYSSTVGNNKVLNLVSIDGFYQVQLPVLSGSLSYPAWSNQVQGKSTNNMNIPSAQ